MGNLRRGDLVWARVVFPRIWWPGLLLKTDSLGCFVSFFGFQNSRYFHPLEVCSFQQHFNLYISSCTCPTSNILLDRAFKFLGQNVAFSLKCPDRSSNPRPGNLFRPQEILGFVRTVSVSPWVEDADFFIAVTVLAQITAFRHHLVNSSGHSTMETNLLSSEMMHTVAEDLHTSGMEEICQVGVEDQVFSEQVEKNFSASLIDRKKMSNLFLEECLSPPNKDQLDIISMIQTKHCKTQSRREMLIKQEVPALNRFYLDKKCPNSLNWSVLSFRNLSYQTTFDICFKKCHPLERSESQSFDSVYIGSPLSVKVHKKTRSRNTIILPLITHMEYPVKCLGLKRQLDQSDDLEPTLKMHKTLLFSVNGADAYLWGRRKEHNNVLSDAYISVDTFSGSCELCHGACAHLQGNIIGFIADLLFGSQARSKTPNLSYIAAQSSTHICSNNSMDLVGNMLNNSFLEHGSPKVLKLDEKDYSLDNSGTEGSCANKQQPEQCETILRSCISDTHDTIEKMLQQPSECQSVSNYETGTHTDDNEANDIGSGSRNEPEMPPVNGDNSISIKISEGSSSMNVRNGELVDFVTLDTASKSQQTQQSEVQKTSAFSKSLLIKFPVNYSLPTKEELVKKFSPFGIIDSFSTKVYFYTGTAQVVFLHQLDAVAAYQYAKRKKIFGEGNVRFWLDPIEHKRGTEFPVRFSSSTAKLPELDLKSCLKKSKSLMKRDKRCPPRKVRFLMET